MTDRALSQACLFGAVATVAAAAVASLIGAIGPALGIVGGGMWNLLNLWCLIRLLRAWLGSQRSSRRVLGWLLLKFPLLYGLLFVVFRHQTISLLGFGIGFTVVLLAALGVLAASAHQMMGVRSDGR